MTAAFILPRSRRSPEHCRFAHSRHCRVRCLPLPDAYLLRCHAPAACCRAQYFASPPAMDCLTAYMRRFADAAACRVACRRLAPVYQPFAAGYCVSLAWVRSFLVHAYWVITRRSAARCVLLTGRKRACACRASTPAFIMVRGPSMLLACLYHRLRTPPHYAGCCTTLLRFPVHAG